MRTKLFEPIGCPYCSKCGLDAKTLYVAPHQFWCTWCIDKYWGEWFSASTGPNTYCNVCKMIGHRYAS